MSDFVLSGVMSFLFADAVSARRSAYIADDGCIVAALNRVDRIVVPTDIDLEKHDRFEDINPRDPSAVSTSARLFDDQAYRGSERCNRSTAPGGHKGVEHSVEQPCTRRHVCACLGTTEMMIVKNYVAPSNIHGVGLFAGENIQCGRKVFVLNDRIDIVMSKSAMQMYGPEFVRFMIIFAYEDFDTHDMYISVDNSRFMNHCSDPNTEWNREYGWATRFISKDEEITCDYHTFWCNAPFADPRE